MVKKKLKISKEIQSCINAAIKAGSPEDQLRNCLTHGYVPLKWQWEFHSSARICDIQDGPVKVGVGGARGPGKSHAVFAQVALDDCQRISGLKFLFLRKTGKAALESFEDLITKVLVGRVRYRKTGSMIIFPNNSKIVLGGFYTEGDIDQYIGIEYDGIAVEELNQLTENKVDKLLGSMRTSKPNWRPRLYASFNPGGIGHKYVKDTFILPKRKNHETDTRFVPSTYKDNPYLNVEYIDYLKKLKGALGIAWREGDFDVFEGQFFDEWRYDIHVVKPFTIPDDWPRYIWGDYGYFPGSSAIYWAAASPNGQVFVYRELYVQKLTHEQLAIKIQEMTPDKEKSRVQYAVFDPALRIRDGHSGKSGQETMLKAGLTTVMGDNDRISGWNQVREYLAPYKTSNGRTTAKLQIFNTCVHLIETVPTMIYQPAESGNPEDMKKKGMEDHPSDSIRYGLMQRPRPKKVPKKVDPSTLPPSTLQEKVLHEQKTLGKKNIEREEARWRDPVLGDDY